MNVAAARLGKFSALCAFLAMTASAQIEPTNRVIVPAGSTWRYQNVEQPPSADWKEINYHQSGWPSGQAQLGYGDRDEQTITRTTPGPHPITAYFRHSF